MSATWAMTSGTLSLVLASLLVYYAQHAFGSHDFAQPGDTDTSHLKQHLAEKIDVDEEWDVERRSFHNFKMADLDEDFQIDGTEVAKYIMHEHDAMDRVWLDEEIETEVDAVMQRMDINHDGTIDYSEYRLKFLSV